MWQESEIVPHNISSAEADRPGKWRMTGAVIVGLLAGFFLSSALYDGAVRVFDNENAEETWGPFLFFWGGHWLLRGIASILAIAWGGFLAGVVAREKGALAAICATLPASLLWGAIGFGGLLGKPVYSYNISLQNSILAIALCLSTPFFAFKAGIRGSSIGQELGLHFDSRPRTLFGIRWFHYLWIPFALNVIALQSAWAFLYALRLYAGFSLVALILQAGILATLSITKNGLARAYLILSGLDSATTHSGVAVLKFGCGLTLLAALLQTGIYGIHYALTKLFR